MTKNAEKPKKTQKKVAQKTLEGEAQREESEAGRRASPASRTVLCPARESPLARSRARGGPAGKSATVDV